jgi:TRAP-type C4-dicarboxylate transport system permease small subunit
MINETHASRLLAALQHLEQIITAVAFAVLVVVLFIDVVSREFTGTGLTWSRQVGVYANLFLTLVGIGLASAGGTHLRPRFADSWLPPAWDHWLESLREAVMVMFFFGAMAVSLLAVAETRALDERVPLLGWPVWTFQLVLPVVFGIAAVRHACYARYTRLRPRELGGGQS